MHRCESMVQFPFSARVGQAAIQAFLHQSGHPAATVGLPGSYSLSITIVTGLIHELFLAALFAYNKQFLPNVPIPARAAAAFCGR